MVAYLAKRIIMGKLPYAVVLSEAWGEYKEDVDAILIAEGRVDLIEEPVKE